MVSCDMWQRFLTFPARHWRGQIALVPTLILTVFGLRAVIAGLGGIASLPLDIGVYFWQITGAVRAMIRRRGDRPDLGLSVLGAGVLVASVPLMIWPHLDRAARAAPPPEILAAPRMNGLRMNADQADLSGPIDFAMFAALETALIAPDGVTTLRLESMGGRVHAARGIARLVREHGLRTRVDGTCASACMLVFIAGSSRVLGPDGRRGFHGYANTSQIQVTDLRQEQAMDRDTFLSEGVDSAFVARIFQVPASEMWFPTRDALIRAGVIASD